MKRYILRRLIWWLPMLMMISVVNFTMMRAAPGDPTHYMIPPGMGDIITVGRSVIHDYSWVEPSEEYRNMMRERLGLDKPLPVQYFHWLRELLTGNLGRSYFTQQPVTSEIVTKGWHTLQISLLALVISMAVGVGLGTVGALRQHSAFDLATTGVTLFLFSMPSFFLGLLFVYVFSLRLGWLPSSQMATPGQAVDLADRLKHYVLPVAVLGLSSSAGVARFTRTAVLEALSADHVVMARAKGLRERTVVARHVLRNAFLPLVTIASGRIPWLLSGAVIIEQMFAWPGLGAWLSMSTTRRDFPVLMGCVTVSAVLTLIATLVGDVLYGMVDPRVRLG